MGHYNVKLDGEWVDIRDMFYEMVTKDHTFKFYLRQWVEYQTDAKKNRLKMHHDIKLKNGEVYSHCYPNGSGWYYGNTRFDDSDVAFIRLSNKPLF